MFIIIATLTCFGLSFKLIYEMVVSPSEIVTTSGLAGPSSFQFSYIVALLFFICGLGLLALLKYIRKGDGNVT